MTTETIPAPGAVTPAPNTPAPAAATPDSAEVKSVSPDAAKPADGKVEADAALAEALEKTEPSAAELARKERNKQRWQTMKQERLEALAEAQRLRMELDRVRRSAPDLSNVTDPDEALALRTAHKVRESMAEDYQSQAQHHQGRAEQALFKAWDAIKEEARGSMPDFDKVVNETTPIHGRMAPMLVESEHAGEIAYYLGSNLKEANDLAQLFETNPARALVEFGKLEAKVSKPAKKTVSQAPKPAPTLSGSASPPSFDPKSAGVSDVQAILKKAGVIR